MYLQNSDFFLCPDKEQGNERQFLLELFKTLHVYTGEINDNSIRSPELRLGFSQPKSYRKTEKSDGFDIIPSFPQGRNSQSHAVQSYS